MDMTRKEFLDKCKELAKMPNSKDDFIDYFVSFYQQHPNFSKSEKLKILNQLNDDELLELNNYDTRSRQNLWS